MNFTLRHIEDGNKLGKALYPCPEGDPKIVYETDNEEVFFRKKLSGRYRIFKKDDEAAYLILKAIADSRYCNEAEFYIHCQGVQEFSGVIKRENVRVNLTSCYVSIDADPFDEYTCLVDNREREVPLYNASNSIIVNQSVSNATYEEDTAVVHIRSDLYAAEVGTENYAVRPSVVYAGTNAIIPSGTERNWAVTTILGPPAFTAEYPYLTAANPLSPNHWCVKETSSMIVEGYDFNNPLVIYIRLETTWHREIITTPLGVPPEGINWILRYSDATNDYYWRCPLVFCTLTTPFRYGRKFDGVAQRFANFYCGLDAVSHLFGIGTPDYDEPDNQYYAAKTNYQNLTWHQKSNVKRPNASDPAEANTYNMSFKDYQETLYARFQVKMDMYKGQLRIEHVSFWGLSDGEDLTLVEQNDIEYTSENQEVPIEERFTSMDEVETPYFAGLPIVYSSCSSADAKDIPDTITTSDICSLLENDEASDAGFVIIASRVEDGVYTMIDGNAPMSWTELHDKFWKYGRPLPNGNMNGVETPFESPQEFREMTMEKTLCCGEKFIPNEIKKTILGNGRVKKAELDLGTRVLTIDLIH